MPRALGVMGALRVMRALGLARTGSVARSFGHGARREVKEPSWKPWGPILPDEKRAPVDQAEPRGDEKPVEEDRTPGAEHPHAPERQLVGLLGQLRKGAP